MDEPVSNQPPPNPVPAPPPVEPGAPAVIPPATVTRAQTPLAPPTNPETFHELWIGTKIMRGALVPLRLAISPLGYVFRIREPLPIYLRSTLPLVLLVAVVVFWHWGTTGDHTLGCVVQD